MRRRPGRRGHLLERQALAAPGHEVPVETLGVAERERHPALLARVERGQERGGRAGHGVANVGLGLDQRGTKTVQERGRGGAVEEPPAANRVACHGYFTVQPYARVIGVLTGWPAITASSATRT